METSTFASLVDPNEGTSLSYFTPSVISGAKCAKITGEDVAPEIAYWKTSILCSVLGANPPLDVMEGYLRRVWNSQDIDKISMVKHGLFLVRFHTTEAQQAVVQRGVFFFDRKPLLVKPWNPELELYTEQLTSLPIWVQLHELDLKYWGMDSLGKIGSILGIPIKTDRYTMEKRLLRYARLLIDIPLDAPFHDCGVCQ